MYVVVGEYAGFAAVDAELAGTNDDFRIRRANGSSAIAGSPPKPPLDLEHWGETPEAIEGQRAMMNFVAGMAERRK